MFCGCDDVSRKRHQDLIRYHGNSMESKHLWMTLIDPGGFSWRYLELIICSQSMYRIYSNSNSKYVYCQYIEIQHIYNCQHCVSYTLQPRACRHGAGTEALRPHNPTEDWAPEDETSDNRTPDEPQWPDPKSEHQDSSPGTGRQDDTPEVSHFPASSSRNALSKTHIWF